MKRPRYLTNVAIKEGEVEIPAFTEIQVFWNEFYVPEHHKEKLEEARRWDLKKDEYVMCLVGTLWVVLGKKEIVERY